MKTILNAEALVRVRIFDKEEHWYLAYQPYKKTFWRTQKEGFSQTFGELLSKEELEKDGFLVIDNVVYHKPYVKLYFTDGVEYSKTFNTYEEAIEWGEVKANEGIKTRLII